MISPHQYLFVNNIVKMHNHITQKEQDHHQVIVQDFFLLILMVMENQINQMTRQ